MYFSDTALISRPHMKYFSFFTFRGRKIVLIATDFVAIDTTTMLSLPQRRRMDVRKTIVYERSLNVTRRLAYWRTSIDRFCYTSKTIKVDSDDIIKRSCFQRSSNTMS